MGGNGRYRAVTGGMGVGAVAVAAAALYRPLPPAPAHYRPDVHAEYVKYSSAGGATVTAYLAYPERKDRAPGVVVIHEIFGLSDWIRQTTEQLAKDGFVALAPDLLSRRGGTPPSGDEARKLIAGLDPDTVTLDLNATMAYLKTLKAVRGDRIGAIGFCWGGGQSFRYATNSPTLRAFAVCYGPAPSFADVARIRAKGLGVYAEDDARIDGARPDVAAAGKQAGSGSRPAVYPGGGDGFRRTPGRAEVADSAWGGGVRCFRENLGR